ncbi:MAG: molybdenum cofactor biosynthesis protein MoaE [Candidatus Hodarchaeota archaeon]
MINRGGIHKRGEVDFCNLLQRLRDTTKSTDVGAIACFIGVVRGSTKTGKKVKKLEIEAWDEKAEEVLTSICNKLSRRKGISEVYIHHIVGALGIGEDIVYVIVAGAHRREVFSTLKEAVERYKKEAPLWKKELLETGETYWVSEGGEVEE